MIRRKMSIPVIALLLGIGIVTTQSAFKPQVNDPNWGFDGVDYHYIGDRTMDNSEDPEPGTYSCLGEENICAGYYSGSGEPTSTTQLVDQEEGFFQLNDIIPPTSKIK